MCGIAGIYRLSEAGRDLGRDAGNGRDRTAVEAMLAPLAPRGPDDHGVDGEGPLTVGNRRLAVLDLTSAGHQPMRSADGRWLLTFNGEIYNFADLRRELGLRPEDLRSRTDTEVLLHAWDRWGVDALPRLVGQWAFAIYDTAAGELWLTRDRFGEKPLFYHRDAGALTFASSIGAVLSCGRLTRELDPAALSEYLTLRYVLSPRTVVAGVQKLPGGHYLHAKGGRVEVRRWYAPRFRSHPSARSRAELVETFDALLRQAARRCLIADVPTALLLSDGIDSNAVRAVLDGGPETVRSFTFVPVNGAARTGKAGGSGAGGTGSSPITTIAVSPRERIDCMIPAFGSLTEPVGDGASLATWLLIRRAREHATVFLCGHGGDEVLGGYRLSQDRFRLALLRRFAWLPRALLGRALDRYLFGAGDVETRRARLRAASAERAPEAARYLIHRPLPEADVHELMGGAPPEEPYLGGVERLYADASANAGDLDRMQEVMLRTFLSENILSFADSVAMDASAELRMPFLDRDLVEFVLSLPPSARVGRRPARSNTKLILRWWASKRLPRAMTHGRKRAFNFGNLPALLSDFGDDVRDLVMDAGALRSALPGLENWLSHAPDTYRGPWEGTLWALLALGVWCEAVGLRG